ncbi:MAG: helix-turn-helix transcriptional regulator [Schlesneria sp.]
MENVTLQNRFQRKLRVALEANGWTQQDMADKLGCSNQMVSQYLLGRRCPGLDVIEKFATTLGLPDAASLIDNSEISLAIA